MVSALLLSVQVLIGQSPTPIPNVASFLKKVKPGMTQDQIRAILPQSTTYEEPKFAKPVDGALTGTVIRFSGPYTGSMSFLRDEQIEALREFAPDVPTEYDPEDPVHGLILTIRKTSTYSKSKGYGLLAELKKALGKPVQNPYWANEWRNDFGGWMAAWKLNGKPLGFYEYSGDVYESRLEFSLGAPIFQGDDTNEIPEVTP